MRTKGQQFRKHESGMTIYIVAFAMLAFLGIAAFAIDLVSYYVARNEAQRGADAAALAGASMFVAQGCTSGSGGCVAGGPQEAVATTQAKTVAAQNPVFGQAPTAATVNVAFNYPNPEEPQITCTVNRTTAAGNPMPTFFSKIFGLTTVDVSASATAEAFNPSGSNVSVGTSCLKPFLVPNCDPAHLVATGSANANVNCPLIGGKAQSYFFYPNGGGIVNPGVYNAANPAAGGVVGEPWALHSESGPSQWYLIGFTGNSGAQLRAYLQTCAPKVIACQAQLNSADGKKVGPTDQGVNGFINANGDGLNQGQDSICSPTSTPACATPPFLITGGANNPNPGLVGQTFLTGSVSTESVAVFSGVDINGQTLQPGGSTVTVLGFMQMFFTQANHNATDDEIDGIILNIGGCGTINNSGGPPVVSQGGSPIPIRLIHQ
jgi:Putative Flp pilus-assembly TadE/G-like